MLRIKLEVDNDRYEGLEDLLALHGESPSYNSKLGIYTFEIQDCLFLNLLFVLHTYVNNKDNFVGLFDWDNTGLIINFEDKHSISIEVYDFYRE